VGYVIALIYCYIISPQFVGSNLVRCLRTVIHPTQHCEYTFDKVYYLPVEKKTIKHIRIEILKMDGARVKYKYTTNPTKLLLHFRRLEK
jgi:hypothetical protein